MGRKIVRSPRMLTHPCVLPSKTSIGAARQWLRDRLNDGEHCPVCGQYAMVYRRPMSSGTAKAVVQTYAAAKLDWVKIQDLPDGPKGGDYAKARFWGLLEESQERREDSGSAGWWRVTHHGQEFVLGELEIMKYVLIYDNSCQGFEGPWIDIHTALGTKFDLRELLQGAQG